MKHQSSSLVDGVRLLSFLLCCGCCGFLLVAIARASNAFGYDRGFGGGELVDFIAVAAATLAGLIFLFLKKRWRVDSPRSTEGLRD